MQFKIPLKLPRITERDIDLILVEELDSSIHFQWWLISTVASRLGTVWSSPRDLTVFHSLRRRGKSSGETDIHMEFTTEINGVVAEINLLIENKINANFGDRQSARYKDEAERLSNIDINKIIAKTVLIAPKEYVSTSTEAKIFDCHILYEEFIDFFLNRIHVLSDKYDTMRYKVKSLMMDQAIHKHKYSLRNNIDYNIAELYDISPYNENYQKLHENFILSLITDQSCIVDTSNNSTKHKQCKRPLSLSHVTERDIDLIIVEELVSSIQFQDWFLSLVGSKFGTAWSSPRDLKIFHSLPRKCSESSGETDIHIQFKIEERGVVTEINLLIENKIDEDFQDRQAVRYRAEAERLSNLTGHNVIAKTILIAPKEYVINSKEANEFDCHVLYEELINFFSIQLSSSVNIENNRRNKFRLLMLEQSIEKYRRGYVQDTDKITSSFYNKYYDISKKVAKDLNLAQQKTKSVDSSWVYFNKSLKQSEKLCRTKLRHKMKHSRVDLEFAGWGLFFDDLKVVLYEILDHGMQIRKASKSLAVTISVPSVNPLNPIDSQYEAITTCLLAALSLQKWYIFNYEKLISIERTLHKYNDSK